MSYTFETVKISATLMLETIFHYHRMKQINDYLRKIIIVNLIKFIVISYKYLAFKNRRSEKYDFDKNLLKAQ